MADGLQTRVDWILAGQPTKVSQANFDKRCEKLASLFCETAGARALFGLHSGLAVPDAKEEALESVRSYALQVRHFFNPAKKDIFKRIEEHIDEVVRGAAARKTISALSTPAHAPDASISVSSVPAAGFDGVGNSAARHHRGRLKNAQLETTRKIIRSKVGKSAHDICKDLANHPLPPGAPWSTKNDWPTAYVSNPKAVQSWISKARKSGLS